MWKLTALDVVKSHLVASFGWEEKDIKLDATVKFQDKFIQMVGRVGSFFFFFFLGDLD